MGKWKKMKINPLSKIILLRDIVEYGRKKFIRYVTQFGSYTEIVQNKNVL